MIEWWCSMFGWLSYVSEFDSHVLLPFLFGFLLKYSSISARLWLLKWWTHGQRKHLTNLRHVWALCSVVRKHMKQALCFLHLFSLYCAVYFLIVQCVELWVFCSQNVQYLSHDGPSDVKPSVKPLFWFDLPYPVSHRVALLAVIPDPSLQYLCFAVGRPGPLTIRYGLFYVLSVCSMRAFCVVGLFWWGWDLSSGLACFLTYCAFSSMFTRLV